MKHAEKPVWQGSEWDKQREDQRQLWIDTLSHARHDWLNDLQLIKGYLQLKKFDKLTECVDMLKQRLAYEGKTARLGHPGLVEAILTYKTKPRPYIFTTIVGETIDYRLTTASGDTAEFAVRRLLEAFEAAAGKGPSGSDNELECAFDREDEDGSIRMRYRGVYSERALRKAVGAVRRATTGLQIEATYEGNQAAVFVRAPISG
ncbi:Spo0B domain-containing protein [Paenibacillus sp. TRM 82003]|nr:Spo0B domain-containing protein [Paenibacillus sp. TRM 82003]